jgi:uncharacterized protein
MRYPDQYAVGGATSFTADRSRAVFGQVMGLVALTVGCTTLGAYIGRNMNGGSGLLFFIGVFGCMIGLQFASRRGAEQLSIALLFGMGLFIGLAVAPVLAYYAKADPGALYESAGATAAFVGGLGAYGYATRRDLSSWYRTLFWALLALIVFGFIGILVAIPGGNTIYAIAGLGIFGAFTILDFNRLKRANMASSVVIAAGIFLDIFNIFLFMLQLFGGNGRD